MTITIVGRIVGSDGIAQRRDVHVDAVDARRVHVEWRSFAQPASQFAPEQNAVIPVDVEHEHQCVGEVRALVRDSGALWAICEGDDDLVDSGPFYYSGETSRRGPQNTPILLEWLALVASPATLGQPPVSILPGTIGSAALEHRSAAHVDRLLQRAVDDSRRRRRGDPLRIVTIDDVLGIETRDDSSRRTPAARAAPAHVWHSAACECATRPVIYR
jgi:hypothetical protein